jgi:predicted nucleic acid-binding protein
LEALRSGFGPPDVGDLKVTEAVLVDTSVWVSHLRFGEERLAKLLNEEKVACHPFVIGELACGTIENREEILTLLNELPKVEGGTSDEVLIFIERNRLMGQGLGLVDVHLLCSAILSGISLWTLDKSLARAAESLDIGVER